MMPHDEIDESVYVQVGRVYWERESLVIEHDPERPDVYWLVLANDYHEDSRGDPWPVGRFSRIIGEPPEEYGDCIRKRNVEDQAVDPWEYLRLRNIDTD